ncbi:MAG: asparaginase [Burkholderiales bacterium]|nr:MAG: asparaginase [Burkholderiales bacterium]
MPTVVVIGTGGTIAGRAASAHDLVGYTAGQVGVAELLAGLGGAEEGPVDVEQVAQINSKDMDLPVWQRLCERVAHHLGRPEVAGLVITHGTDTLEETAFLLQCLIRPAKPVVLTCAMRPATALAPDGPQNLGDALRLARHPGAQGVLVACAGRVHGAAEVSKVHTYRLDAFDSGDAGPVAQIENGQVRCWRPWPGQGFDAVPDGRKRLQAFLALDGLPRVELLYSHACADGEIVRALLAQSVSAGGRLQGLVVAGTGNGTLHHRLEDALAEALAAGVRVVRATRCAQGQVIPLTEDRLEPSRGLSPVKARLALMLDLIGH